MAKVDLEFLATDGQAAAVIARLEKRLDGLDNKMKRTRDAGAKSDPFNSWGLSLDRVAVGMIGITAPMEAFIRLVNVAKTELDDLHKRQDAAKTKQLSYAGALEKAALNSMGDKDLGDVKKLDAAVKAISGRTGANADDVAREVAAGMSAKGDLPGAAVAGAVEAAAKLVPHSPEARPALVGAALDTMKFFIPEEDRANMKAEDYEKWSKRSLGFALALGKEARTPQLEDTAKNVLPAGISVAMAGKTSLRSGAALAAAMSQGMLDPTGAMSGTAAIQLEQQLAKHFPELKNFDERLAHVQNDAGARQKFLKGMSVEAKARAPVTSLLEGGKVAKMYDAARASLPDLGAADANVNEFMDARGGIGAFNIADADLKNKSLAGRLKLADTWAARVAVARQGLDEGLAASGEGWMGRSAGTLGFDLSVGVAKRRPEDVLIEKLEGRAQVMQTVLNAANNFDNPEKKESDRKMLEAMQEQIKELRETNDLLKRGLPGPVPVNRNPSKK